MTYGWDDPDGHVLFAEDYPGYRWLDATRGCAAALLDVAMPM